MIREVINTDIEVIATISQTLGYEGLTVEHVEQHIKTILDSHNDELFVYDDGEVKGWIHFFISNRVTTAPFIEIGGLAVSSDFQRLGIGRELIRYVETYACNRKMKIRVRCNTKRESAHKFYISLGFSKAKDQSVYELTTARSSDK